MSSVKMETEGGSREDSALQQAKEEPDQTPNQALRGAFCIISKDSISAMLAAAKSSQNILVGCTVPWVEFLKQMGLDYPSDSWNGIYCKYNIEVEVDSRKGVKQWKYKANATNEAEALEATRLVNAMNAAKDALGAYGSRFNDRATFRFTLFLLRDMEEDGVKLGDVDTAEGLCNFMKEWIPAHVVLKLDVYNNHGVLTNTQTYACCQQHDQHVGRKAKKAKTAVGYQMVEVQPQPVRMDAVLADTIAINKSNANTIDMLVAEKAAHSAYERDMKRRDWCDKRASEYQNQNGGTAKAYNTGYEIALGQWLGKRAS
jgi:hypothetical protein